MTEPAPDLEQIYQMSSAEAHARLAEMKTAFDRATYGEVPKNPSNGVEAQRRLDAVAKNPKWADKYERGDIETRAEFNRLTEMADNASEADRATAGYMPPNYRDFGPGAHLRDQIAAVEDLRQVEDLDRRHDPLRV